jgi:hypothetical protein
MVEMLQLLLCKMLTAMLRLLGCAENFTTSRMLLIKLLFLNDSITEGENSGFLESILNNIWIDFFQIFDIVNGSIDLVTLLHSFSLPFSDFFIPL